MKIAALAGGVGGARLAHGLSEILEPEELSIVVNTGDDFEHFGLHISPDLDTVCYTLAGIANPETGWGIAGDSFETLNALSKLGAPDWFQLGDIDLATHLERTRLLRQEVRLTQITQQISGKIGVRHSVLPMTDDEVATWVETEELGLIPFQEYFVKHLHALNCRSFQFKGIESASASSEVVEVIQSADAIVFCPSNPFVSIDPILNLKGLRDLIDQNFVLCVSPIISGKAVKGPLAKMFQDFGYAVSPQSVIDHYRGLVDCILIESSDLEEMTHETRSSIIIQATDILIPEKADRIRLAREVIELISKNL